ncbi:MAG: NAD-dependent epimerase/dehydratase family protein [Candidatus Eisenbacteria bacterium]|nr:NAD-dependent epimerase/dehydratase family protein [Candidatus Eisenbacteria bacterium]
MSGALVTGAGGFTGGALCRRLAREGGRVAGLVRTRIGADELERIGVEPFVGDLTDPGSIAAAFRGIDVVYHLAAAYRREHASREEFHRVNVEGTRHALDAAEGAGVGRFVHCSTVGVHGDVLRPPADENAPFAPGDHYQRSKLEGELLARERFAAGLPGATVRPVGIYGPGDRRFLKLFRLIDRGAFVMIGSGRGLYQMTHVDDLVEGFLLCGRRPEAIGETFIIGGPPAIPLRELAAAVADALGRPRPRLRLPYRPVYTAAWACDRVCRIFGLTPPLYPRRVTFFHGNRSFSIEKARRLLGYEPAVSLREGLAATAAWYREEGWL